MNTTDFYNGMEKNREFDARRQAQADYAYAQEMEKLHNDHPAPNNDPTMLPDIYARLEALEHRVEELEGRVTRSPFVVVNENNVNAMTAISLTDPQLKEFISSVIK